MRKHVYVIAALLSVAAAVGVARAAGDEAAAGSGLAVEEQVAVVVAAVGARGEGGFGFEHAAEHRRRKYLALSGGASGGHGRELADGPEAVRAYFEEMHRQSMEIFAALTPEGLAGKCRTPSGIRTSTRCISFGPFGSAWSTGCGIAM